LVGGLDKSASCQDRAHALPAKSSPFDCSIGGRKQRRRDNQTECLGRLKIAMSAVRRFLQWRKSVAQWNVRNLHQAVKRVVQF
jgi:hypothetical protein